MNIPRISIVVPSFNQVSYLEQTIVSIIGQNYPNLEVIVMDGGSTDGSVKLLEKYDRYLTSWVSQRDDGQAAAINSGFSQASGDILGWLNSDDLYLPHTLSYVAANLPLDRAGILIGNCIHFREGDPLFAVGSDVVTKHKTSHIAHGDYIIQPSSFFSRKAWTATGSVDASLRYAFDWDWFIRAAQSNVEFHAVDRHLSMYRFHHEHKTGSGGVARISELRKIYEKYSGHRFAKLFDDCVQDKRRMWFMRAKARRLNRPDLEIAFLRAVWFRRFRGFTDQEVLDVMDMA